MSLINELLQQTEQIDFLFPNSFEELMNNKYYDYDKFEWFLYYVFKMEGAKVTKVGKKGKGDGGADLIITIDHENGYNKRIGIQAKYWKNKVGTEPLNQLASAKARHSLNDLWIITTSDLTSDAKEIAESLSIKVLRANDVKKFIETVKKRYEKEMNETGQASISFLNSTAKVINSNSKKQSDSVNHKDQMYYKLKKLRLDLSVKHKLTPVYTVFNNETIEQIIKEKPTSIEELRKIKGLGEKKVDLFGQDILNLFNSSNTDHKLYEALLKERIKIAKFNKMNEEDVYSDKVASYLSKMKPQNIESLKKIYGFKLENINIFGDYLVKFIHKYIESIS